MLRELLTLDQQVGTYEKVKQGLLDAKLIVMYRCRGGGVQLTSKGETKAYKSTIALSKNIVKKEGDLYAPLKLSLERSAEDDAERCFVEITGKSQHSGKWSNPDLVKVSFEKYKYLKIQRVIVSTYEVKKFDGLNVDAVFEALAHARFANYVYLVAEADGKEYMPPIDVVSLCQTHGVGLLKMYKHYSHFKHEVLIQPRMQPALEDDLEDFLSRMFDRMPHALTKYSDFVEGNSLEQ
jgi:hypothetical protein